MDNPRELTMAEVRDMLLDHFRELITYWESLPNKTIHDRLDGLAFSMLATLDGDSLGVPGFLLIPDPHPDDKKDALENGENWCPEDGESDIGILHEFWYKKGQ